MSQTYEQLKQENEILQRELREMYWLIRLYSAAVDRLKGVTPWING